MRDAQNILEIQRSNTRVGKVGVLDFLFKVRMNKLKFTR